VNAIPQRELHLPNSAGEAAGSQSRILVVDDERAIVSTVVRRLQREADVVSGAHSGEAALERFDAQGFDIVVTDISMPGMSGLDLLGAVKERDPLVQVIIMTAHAQLDLVVRALRLHADDYLLKPFDLEQLVHAVRRAAEHRRLMLENQLYRSRLEERVHQQARRLEGLYLAGIRALIAALEARDPRTRGHSDRVTQYSLRIAHALGDVDTRKLALGAALHDIGKIGTRDEVLSKPGPLTPDELHHIREHPVTGVRILEPMLDDAAVLGVVRHHHERWDGRGYPDGIAGQKIPRPARVVAVADSLDAITSPRAYRARRDWGAAIDEITACAGTQFDPDVVHATLAVLREPPAAVAS
jgi:cyclic di-GMP phosphodiesterase